MIESLRQGFGFAPSILVGRVGVGIKKSDEDYIPITFAFCLFTFAFHPPKPWRRRICLPLFRSVFFNKVRDHQRNSTKEEKH